MTTRGNNNRAPAGISLTIPEILELLKQHQGERTAKKFAREIGIDNTLLSMVYNGHRDPNDVILRYLGVKKIVSVTYLLVPEKTS